MVLHRDVNLASLLEVGVQCGEMENPILVGEVDETEPERGIHRTLPSRDVFLVLLRGLGSEVGEERGLGVTEFRPRFGRECDRSGTALRTGIDPREHPVALRVGTLAIDQLRVVREITNVVVKNRNGNCGGGGILIHGNPPYG